MLICLILYPWRKSDIRYWLLMNPEQSMNPRHNSFTTDEEGNDILVYHARKEKVIEGDPLYNPNRLHNAYEFTWENENQNSPMDKTETFEIRTEKGRRKWQNSILMKKTKGTYQSRIIW